VLAAKAGAKHVYAIEASGLAVKARENIVKNGFKDQITYVSPCSCYGNIVMKKLMIV